jgi:hypothetical protein
MDLKLEEAALLKALYGNTAAVKGLLQLRLGWKTRDGGRLYLVVCGADFEYTRGGYHCEGCRNWDCCVSCGSSSAKRPGGAGGAGQGKGNKKGKQRR